MLAFDSTPLTPIPVLMMARELGWGGGVERDISKFARHLPPYGIVPHVASFRAGGARWAEIEAAGIPIWSLNVDSLRSWSALSAVSHLRRYAAEHNIQVLHAFDAPANIFGVPLARRIGIPVAISSHLWCRKILPLQMRVLLALVDNFATGLFVNCHAVAQDLTRNWHVSPKRIHICHNGFEPREFNDRNRTRPIQFANASVVVGTVAVLRQEKNIGLLIRAFASVRNVDPLARLVVVGDGPMKAALERQALDLKMQDACVFEPATAQPANWMRAIDVFVSTSTSEAFSNSLLEAMASGCCPVASRVGGTPELIKHGERGLLFDADNLGQLTEALSSVIVNAERRQEMASSAARFAHECLRIDQASLCLASIYKQLLTSVGALSSTNMLLTTRGKREVHRESR